MQPGTRLGPYEIVALLGAGGMGEVFRARDTRLQREVAIKTLPEVFAGDPERLARFEREAQVLAALNHPHIAQIYGIEESGGVGPGANRALVMELVEGDTLADGIARGPMALEEALAITRQIIDALEAAHEHGIVHRDLKPANIKITSQGVVKVLDFGLAKLALPAGAAPSASPAVSMSPTMLSPAGVTSAGVLLGTAAYMSPEQARGQFVDKRADIWAFGVVLWEMLTGRILFGRDTISDTIAAVLKEEPAWDGIPPHFQRLIARCLQKDPRHRLRDVGDARMFLDAAWLPSPGVATDEPKASRWRRVLAMALAVVAASSVTGVSVWRLTRPVAPAVVRLTVPDPLPEVIGGNDFDDNLAISPDGRYVAFTAAIPSTTSNTLRLYLRALDQPTPVILSTSARTPFFSPDGQFVAFVEDNDRLSKVPVSGGPAVRIGGRANAPRGATWTSEGRIVFATADTSTGLFAIADGGGEPALLTRPDSTKGEVDHVFPDALPDGKAVLFTITTEKGADNSQVAVLDLQTNTQRVLIQGGAHPRYVAPGYIVYATGAGLRAVAFDRQRLEIRGKPVPVLDGVDAKPSGSASFAVASNGTLAYIEGNPAERQRALVWVDRQGREQTLGLEPRNYQSFALSPDGKSVAVTIGSERGESDIWIWSQERQTLNRLTFEGGTEVPLWSPDGKRIVYTVYEPDINLVWRMADGTGSPQRLLPPNSDRQRIAVTAGGWTPDGRLIFDELRRGRVLDVKVLSLAGNGAPSSLIGEGTYAKTAGAVSPDGRWVAYVSVESGNPEVYVRPYPNVNGGQWQVSTDRGSTPRWAKDSRTLHFIGQSGVMSSSVEPGPTFSASRPVLAMPLPSNVRFSAAITLRSDFELSPDGQRLLFMKTGDPEAAPHLNVILNWISDLARRMAAT